MKDLDMTAGLICTYDLPLVRVNPITKVGTCSSHGLNIPCMRCDSFREQFRVYFNGYIATTVTKRGIEWSLQEINRHAIFNHILLIWIRLIRVLLMDKALRLYTIQNV
jgi:hypothetical protein